MLLLALLELSLESNPVSEVGLSWHILLIDRHATVVLFPNFALHNSRKASLNFRK